MRWRKRHTVSPEVGEKRLRSGFLWFPRVDEGGEHRWLEYAYWTEVYCWIRQGEDSAVYGWSLTEWR